MVKIRLLRVGAKKRAFYRIVAIDERRKRNGRALEFLGTYDPVADPPRLDVKREQVDAWIAKGAQMTDSARAILRRSSGTAAASAPGAEAPSAAPPATS